MNVNELMLMEPAEITIGYRTKVPPSLRKKIMSSRDCYEMLKPIFEVDMEHREIFVCLFANRANKVLGYKIISTGGVAGTAVDPKMIFQAALKANACSIVMAHNHPSGNIKPSEADIKLTRKCIQGGVFLDLPVMDHLIITDEGYFSFADEGMIS
jgi:DNA repair protein RadC